MADWLVYEAEPGLVVPASGRLRLVAGGRTIWVTAQNWVTARAEGALRLGLPTERVDAMPVARPSSGIPRASLLEEVLGPLPPEEEADSGQSVLTARYLAALSSTDEEDERPIKARRTVKARVVRKRRHK